MIQCIVNRKIYVGYSKDIYTRWKRHRQNFKKGKANSHMQSTYNLYGPKCFIYGVLEECTPDLLAERETHWITALKTTHNKKGFNITKDLKDAYRIKTREENNRKKSDERKKGCPVVAITKEGVCHYPSIIKAAKSTGVPAPKVLNCLSYWRGLPSGEKSRRGYIFVRLSEYTLSFDYLGYKKLRKGSRKGCPNKKKKLYL